MVHVSVIIPTFNSAEHIGKNLSGLCKQDFELNKVEIIVVDGFSSDGTDEILEKYARIEYPNIRIYKKAERNIAAARNLGISKASGQTIVFLDSDCYPLDTRWLRNLVTMEKGDDIIVGRNLVPKRTLAQRFVRALDQLGTPDLSLRGMETGASPKLFSTTNVAIRKEVFRRIGLLDEDIGSFREDTDFSFRARLSGVRIKYKPKAVAVHEHRQSIADLWSKSYERSRNAVGFYRKYGLLNKFSRTQLMKTFATVTTLLLMLFALAFSVSIFLYVFSVLYFILFARFLLQTKTLRDSLLFPFIYVMNYVMVSVGTFGALITLAIHDAK